MKTLKDVQCDDNDFMSLAKMLPDGVTIKDIVGMRTAEFGAPMFQLCWVLLSDGTKVFVGGEHDMPFLEECEHLDGLLEELAETES
jgi:hypothetical protein